MRIKSFYYNFRSLTQLKSTGKVNLGLILTFVVIAVGILLALPLVLSMVSSSEANLTQDVRGAVLSQMSESISLSEKDKLEWAPALGIGAYHVGSVFEKDENFIRITDQCRTESIKISGGPSTKHQISYRVSPRADMPPGLTTAIGRSSELNVELGVAVKVIYNLDIDKTELISSKRTLFNSLVENPNCLADIANREVQVLTVRIIGRERYDFE